MNESLSFVAGVGLGAGLMYILDPEQGRHRRALARDKAVRLAHEAEDALGVVSKDVRNRAQGLAAGDLSVLVGGKRALAHPLSGRWSPTGRAILSGLGIGLFAYGLTRSAPAACLFGSAGCALLAEGIANIGLEDLTNAGRQLTGQTQNVTNDGASRVRASTRQRTLQVPTGV